MVLFIGDIMFKSLEELREDYIKELAEVEKKIENTRKRLKRARLKRDNIEIPRLEKLLYCYEDMKDDFEYSIKQLNEYCD